MALSSDISLHEISSAQNQRYKGWLRLLDAKGIKKQGEGIIAGRSFIHEITARYPERVNAILISHEHMLESLPVPQGKPVYLLSPALFAELDIYGTKAPLLILSAPPLPEWSGTLTPGLTIFLPFQNPINLGTTIRTAAALGAEVVLLQEAASPYLPKSLRASGPAILQTPVWQGPSMRELAHISGLPLFALSPRGPNIYTVPFPATVGLVAGMEGPGLDEFWPEEQRLSIPMRPEVESLNAAIAISMGMTCWQASLYREHK